MAYAIRYTTYLQNIIHRTTARRYDKTENLFYKVKQVYIIFIIILYENLHYSIFIKFVSNLFYYVVQSQNVCKYLDR